ncbi:MAG TPA: hypothetical protein GXX49_03105 [Clostridiaceae bacterium]|nr:hypothetical protein [Clostridiaceae bacterium]
MGLKISAVRSDKEKKEFIMLPFRIYKDNKYWVPPLISDMKDTLDESKNPLFLKGEHELFIAILDGKTVGRICTGYDNTLLELRHDNSGYITMFECIDNYEVARVLFDTAIKWLKDKGYSSVRGPISPKGGGSDECRGLLVNAFDQSPVLMNSYNPEYYVDFFDNYGFKKYLDLYAYLLDPKLMFDKNPEKTILYAQKRYNFRVDPINLKKIDDEIHAIKYILDLAVPEEWADMAPPTLEEVRSMADQLMKFADPDIIPIARSGDEPIGFGIALPDYNQVLKHMNGRMNPLSIMKFLWYKRKIDCARFFVMFVIPSFRKKGVSYAIYYFTFVNGLKKGYRWGEGSTIGETNTNMRTDIENCGGKHYKTYRIYQLDF